MYITKLKLENIGPYVGINEIDLEPKPTKNIILIGGKNGSGKTTLLKSIRVALFGSYSFGLKTESSTYFEELKKLFNYRVLKQDSPRFMMSIEYVLNEEYASNFYSITREWTISEGQIIETHEVRKNQILLDQSNEEIVFIKLKEIYPPTLIDAFLFDGEKVGNIIESEMLAPYVKDIFYSNFGVNYFEKLHDDLNYYKNNELDSSKKSNEEMLLEKLEQQFQQLAIDRDEISKDLIAKNTLRFNMSLKSKEVQRRLSSYGGITTEQKEVIFNEVKDVKNRINKEKGDFQKFFEEDLFFYIHRDLVDQAISQIEKEKPARFLRYLNEIHEFISDERILSLKDDISKMNVIENKAIFQNVDKSSAIKLENKRNYLRNIDLVELTNKYKKFISESSNINLKTKLLNNINDQELIDIMNELDNSISALSSLSSEITNLEERKNQIITSISSLRETINELETKIRKQSNEENSYSVALNIISTVERFKNYFVKEKLKEVSSSLLINVNKIFSKTTYVKDIKIDEDFNIKITDLNNDEMPIYVLSAGEKQLIVACLIYTLVKMSRRNLMFVFDTPLARLDKSNRINLVNTIMKDISEQTIILSTDTEIVGNLALSLKDRVAKSMKLNYVDIEGVTRVQEGYFEVQT